jgi:hypothetical protein
VQRVAGSFGDPSFLGLRRRPGVELRYFFSKYGICFEFKRLISACLKRAGEAPAVGRRKPAGA